MKVQLNISGTPDEIKEAVGALATLGGVKVIVSAKEEKLNPYPGLNRSGAVRNMVVSSKDKPFTVDEVALNLHIEFPNILVAEWKQIISRLTNPKYSTHCINRVKGYSGHPGTDKLLPLSEGDVGYNNLELEDIQEPMLATG